MKYYAVKMNQNQYSVLEVDGSEKIGLYQVDELVVTEMYNLAEQGKLNLVIQECDGKVIYAKMHVKNRNNSTRYWAFIICTMLEVIALFGASWNSVVLFFSFCVVVTTNILFGYYYRKGLSQSKMTKYCFSTARFEIDNLHFKKQSSFLVYQLIKGIVLSGLLLAMGVNYFGYHFMSPTTVTLLLICVIIGFSIWYSLQFQKNENETNLLGLQPTINASNQLFWVENGTLCLEENKHGGFYAYSQQYAEGGNKKDQFKFWFVNQYKNHKARTIILVLVMIGVGGQTTIFGMNNILFNETTCTVSKKEVKNGKRWKIGYSVTCDGTNYMLSSELSFFGLNKAVSEEENDAHYAEIKINKMYHIKYKGLDKIIYEYEAL